MNLQQAYMSAYAILMCIQRHINNIPPPPHGNRNVSLALNNRKMTDETRQDSVQY